MANNKFNKYIGALALGVAILAVPSCSDEHFDVNYNDDPSGVGIPTKSLWELIKENPNLSKFKNIVEKAQYWKDENHPVKDYTYANVLQEGQIATVWAPENAYFPDSEYQKWLSMCETDGYNVQQQFIGNHIALWRNNISGTDSARIKMINGKNLIFDKRDTANCTMQDIPIDIKNIAATNGTMHTIKGTTPFHYNFYEYLKFSPSLPLLSQYVVSKDTTEFYKEASIEGLPDKDGNPSYVDSVYRTSNILFERHNYLPQSGAENWEVYQECFDARINVEDSAFVMILPTDEAWTKAKQKLAPYYKYADKYEDKEKGNVGTTAYRTISNTDSLANMCMDMDITTPLVFNMNKQPKVGDKLWTLEDFIENKGATAKYLLNTYGDTLRNITDSTYTWDKTSLFNGNLVEMSNGYGYEVNEWAFPQALYRPDIEVEISEGSFYYTTHTTYYKAGPDTKTVGFNNSIYSYIADKYGYVSNNNFFYFTGTGPQANPHGEIKLTGRLYSTSPVVVREAEVMSGKYDIYVVMVPDWYKKIADEGNTLNQNYYNQEYIDSISALSKMSFKYQIRYCANAANGKDAITKSTNVINYDGSKVDTILIEKDFEFPYSYKNMRYSYPTLVIDGATTKKTAPEGYLYTLCIDRVILKSKETGEETIVAP